MRAPTALGELDRLAAPPCRPSRSRRCPRRSSGTSRLLRVSVPPCRCAIITDAMIDLHSPILPGLDDGPADDRGVARDGPGGRRCRHAGRCSPRRTSTTTPNDRPGADRGGARRARTALADAADPARGAPGRRDRDLAPDRPRRRRLCARSRSAAAPTCSSRARSRPWSGTSSRWCSTSTRAAIACCSRTRSAARPSSATPRGSSGSSTPGRSCRSRRAR